MTRHVVVKRPFAGHPAVADVALDADRIASCCVDAFGLRIKRRMQEKRSAL